MGCSASTNVGEPQNKSKMVRHQQYMKTHKVKKSKVLVSPPTMSQKLGIDSRNHHTVIRVGTQKTTRNVVKNSKKNLKGKPVELEPEIEIVKTIPIQVKGKTVPAFQSLEDQAIKHQQLRQGRQQRKKHKNLLNAISEKQTEQLYNNMNNTSNNIDDLFELNLEHDEVVVEDKEDAQDQQSTDKDSNVKNKFDLNFDQEESVSMDENDAIDLADLFPPLPIYNRMESQYPNEAQRYWDK